MTRQSVASLAAVLMLTSLYWSVTPASAGGSEAASEAASQAASEASSQAGNDSGGFDIQNPAPGQIHVTPTGVYVTPSVRGPEVRTYNLGPAVKTQHKMAQLGKTHKLARIHLKRHKVHKHKLSR